MQTVDERHARSRSRYVAYGVGLVLLMCLVLGALIECLQRVRVQRVLLDEFERLGGTTMVPDLHTRKKGAFFLADMRGDVAVVYAGGYVCGPAFIRRFLGDDLFLCIDEVNLGTRANDSLLSRIEALSTISVLSVTSPKITDDDLESVVCHGNLESLTLDCSSLTDVGLERLAELNDLKRLTLHNYNPGETPLEFLPSLKRLENLQITGPSFRGQGLTNVKTLVNLRTMDLSDTQVSGDCFAGIGSNTRLAELYLNNTLVNNDGLFHLGGLRSLTLSGTKISDEGLKHLMNLELLERLDLSDTRIRGSGLAALRGLRNLDLLWLDSTDLEDDGLAKLAGMRLRTLYLRRTRVTDIGLEHLTDVQTLESVDARFTQVTASGAEALRVTLPGAIIYHHRAESTEVDKDRINRLFLQLQIEEYRANHGDVKFQGP